FLGRLVRPIAYGILFPLKGSRLLPKGVRLPPNGTFFPPIRAGDRKEVTSRNSDSANGSSSSYLARAKCLCYAEHASRVTCDHSLQYVEDSEQLTAEGPQ